MPKDYWETSSGAGEPDLEREAKNGAVEPEEDWGVATTAISFQLPVLQLESPSARGPLRDRNADAEWVLMALQLVSEV